MVDYAWYPHPGPQSDFCSRWEEEVLFGGAAGPGKTDCLIMDATRYVEHPKYRSIIFRRTHPEILDILDRMHLVYPTMGAEYRAGEHRWYFPSGAKIHLGHMSDENAYYRYQGKEFHDVRFDEAGQFLPKQLAYLFSRCRTTIPEIPKRIRYASNPGGPAHQFLKDRFRIAQYPNGYKTFREEINLTLPTGQVVEEKIHRVFIPGKVWDNPSLIENDPGYLAFLTQLPEIERLRLMEGRWDAFEGQFFPEINEQLHGFGGEIPNEWEAYAAFDWGYARPWAYGIFRVDHDGRIWLDHIHYATKEGFTNVGVRQSNVEIARTIRDIEKDYPAKIKMRLAGADIWLPKKNRDGIIGPAPADDMSREGINFIKADNNRIQGWQQVHLRLAPEQEDGEPMLKVRNRGLDFRELNPKSGLFSWWRSMQNLMEDEHNPEDIPLKDIEDHLPELTRYACMHRPIRPKIPSIPDHGSFQAERRKLLAAKRYANRYGISLERAYRR